jgi:hypothetical protein
MADVPMARVAQARIIPPAAGTLFPSPSEAVRDILVAGARHFARTRTWYFGGVRQNVDHVVARLGYKTEEETDLYDEESKDFKQIAVVRGRTVKFVVRLTDLVVVYARRRSGMPDQDFTSGLRFMLRACDLKRKWDVASMGSPADFDDWALGVDLVNRFRFHTEGITLPAADDSSIPQILLEPRAERLTLDLRAKFGLDINHRIIRECLDMADGGLGEVLAVGQRNEDGTSLEQKAWVSANSAERVTHQVPADADAGDVAESTLLDILAAQPVDNPW